MIKFLLTKTNKMKIEELKNQWKKFLKQAKEVLFGKETGSLSAKEAWNLVRYGMLSESIDKVILNEISRIERLIIYKAETSNKEDSLIITVPDNKMDLYEKIKEHFSKRNFICFFTSFKEVEDEKFLIISWKDGGGNSNK